MPSTAATLTARVRRAAKILQDPPPEPCDGRSCCYGIPHHATDHADEEVLSLFNKAEAVAWQTSIPGYHTHVDLLLYTDGSIAYFNAPSDDPNRIDTGTITDRLEKRTAHEHLTNQEKAGQGSQLVEQNLIRWLRRRRSKQPRRTP